MWHATHRTAPTSENPTVTAFRGISDPLERARRCQEFLSNGRETIRAVEQLRDDAIREARTQGQRTIDALANHIGARRNVIIDALRQRR